MQRNERYEEKTNVVVYEGSVMWHGHKPDERGWRLDDVTWDAQDERTRPALEVVEATVV